MSKTAIILDDTPASQHSGLVLLQAIGTLVDSVQFTAIAELIAMAIDTLSHLAATIAGVKVGDGGNLLLPIIWTAGEPIYRELIMDEIDDLKIERSSHPIGIFPRRAIVTLE